MAADSARPPRPDTGRNNDLSTELHNLKHLCEKAKCDQTQLLPLLAAQQEICRSLAGSFGVASNLVRGIESDLKVSF
jgi:hypothetical protein